MEFWDVVWSIVVGFAFVAYLIVMFAIIADLFRDRSVSGWAKALWVIALIFLPFLTSFVYLIARGSGMAERSRRDAVEAHEAQEDYIRSVASSSGTPIEQISRARTLQEQGAITQDEFDMLKARALA